ncbi:LuxR C-terminal-related transcriptional regulator [Kitasatospora sp. NPDC048365]|uniref:LuxR C-terminal-related transcriptional regulator n=1 Tax=Kitasatospora sp. NPDC048365 TaxID=3364050 RepID=UPI00371077C6
MTTPSPPTSPETAEPPQPGGPSARARADAAKALRLLTPREAEVLARLAAGDDLRAAADHLGLAPATARAYVHRAMRKLGVSSRDEALALTGLLAGPTPAPAPASAPTPPPTPTAAPTPPPAGAAPLAPSPTTTTPTTPPTPATAPGPTPSPAAAAPLAPSPTTPSPAATPAPAPAPAPGTVPESEPAPAATPEAEEAPQPSPAPAPAPAPAEPDPAAPPAVAAEAAPAGFAELCAVAHTRLVQQTYLLTGHRRRATHCVNLALGDACRSWAAVSALPDPEGWVRARAFESALSPWRRGSPRRSHLLRLPHRRIKVGPATEPEAPNRLTPRDRALLKALHRLSRPQRQALVLHDTLGLPVSAVAASVESSTAAAEGRVLTARAALARSVPELVGGDPAEDGFGERLGGLLYRAAVHGCPSPRLHAPAMLASGSRLRSTVTTGSAALLSVAMGTAVVTTLLGSGPSDLFRPAEPAPPAVCTTASLGSAGPAAQPDGSPGLRSAWCSPAPGLPARLVAPPALAAAAQPSGAQPSGAQPSAGQAPVAQDPTQSVQSVQSPPATR